MKLFSVFDRKAVTWGPPMQFKTDELARRSGVTLLKSGDSEIAKFPEDFDLYYVGTFDDDNGLLTGDTPRLVFCFSDLVGA